MKAILNNRNQVTIPKAVRDHLDIRPGDTFKFFFQPDGAVVIVLSIAISKIKGSLPKLKQPVSIEEIHAAIETGATERFRK